MNFYQKKNQEKKTPKPSPEKESKKPKKTTAAKKPKAPKAPKKPKGPGYDTELYSRKPLSLIYEEVGHMDIDQLKQLKKSQLKKYFSDNSALFTKRFINDTIESLYLMMKNYVKPPSFKFSDYNFHKIEELRILAASVPHDFLRTIAFGSFNEEKAQKKAGYAGADISSQYRRNFKDLITEIIKNHKDFFAPAKPYLKDDIVNDWDSIKQRPKTDAIKEREEFFQIELDYLKEEWEYAWANRGEWNVPTVKPEDREKLTKKYEPIVKKALEKASKDTKVYLYVMTPTFHSPISYLSGTDKALKVVLA